MSTQAERQLEAAALDGHRRGLSWGDFWDEHGAEVCAAEPYNRPRFQRLVAKLLHLVASGEESGQEPAGEPWLLDSQLNQPSPHDSLTRARCQLPLWPGRHKLPVDGNLVEGLAAVGCTSTKIAAVAGCSHSTISR